MSYANEGQIRGAGDLVAKITKVTMIDKAVKTVAKKMGKDCGCEARREVLNTLIPFKNVNNF
jgi:hypothetical protein